MDGHENSMQFAEGTMTMVYRNLYEDNWVACLLL